jgi:hypothetical protein
MLRMFFSVPVRCITLRSKFRLEKLVVKNFRCSFWSRKLYVRVRPYKYPLLVIVWKQFNAAHIVTP